MFKKFLFNKTKNLLFYFTFKIKKTSLSIHNLIKDDQFILFNYAET